MNKKEVIKLLKTVALLGMAFLVMILVVSAVEKKQAENSTEVVIDIQPLKYNKFLIDQEDVKTTIERSFGYSLEGKPIGAINVERVERVLRDDPFVLDAEVYVDAQNTVKITLIQREPLLRIIDKNGLNYYIDKNGIKMPLSSHYSARVLVATGNIPPHVPNFLNKKKHLLKDLYNLTNYILNDEFLTALVEQIYITNSGEFILIPKIGKHKILFGKYEDIADKFKRLKVFYKEVLPFEGWRKYKTINLKFKKQVVCK